MMIRVEVTILFSNKIFILTETIIPMSMLFEPIVDIHPHLHMDKISLILEHKRRIASADPHSTLAVVCDSKNSFGQNSGL